MRFLSFFRVDGFALADHCSKKNSLVNFNSTLGKSITNYISVIALFVENFVWGALWKELFNVFFHFIEWFKAYALRSYWQILTVFLCYSIKDHIFLAALFVEGFAQGTQRTEVNIALFVKRFKSFMVEVPILLKSVHWFPEQINGLFSRW